MDARPQGMGPALLGWFWDGEECISHNANGCMGANCDDAFGSLSECQAAFAGCTDD
jgi:hypothetical protein